MSLKTLNPDLKAEMARGESPEANRLTGVFTKFKENTVVAWKSRNQYPSEQELEECLLSWDH